MGYGKRAGEKAEKLLMKDCEVVAEELEMSLERLKEFTKPYLELMPRVEMQRHGEDFLEGLLSDLERKSVEPIAERLGQYRRPLQYFIGASPWDHQLLLEKLSEQVAQELGEPNGILVIDPSTFPKKGKDSVGVARQWCGRLGKMESCQKGIFLGYVTNRGHTLVDERLYLPKEWTGNKGRKDKCGVPKGVRFKTAQKLSLELLEECREILPHRWVVADDEFGRPFAFREALEEMGERYLLEIPSNLLVRVIRKKVDEKIGPAGKGRKKTPYTRVNVWKNGLKKADWEKIRIREGTKGPLTVWAARVRVQTKYRGRRSKKMQWLLVIKTEGRNPEYRYYLSNAEEDIRLGEMVHAASARHWVEDCFERAKGEAGLDHYEVRSWRGWHHHITLSLLALYFLVLEQRRLNQKTPALTLQQSSEAIGEILRNPGVDLYALALKITHRLRRIEQSRIDHWKKFQLLPPPWTVTRSNYVPYFTQ
jgi:SRSO17 transposase